MVLFGADHALDVVLHPVAAVAVLPALAALPQAVLAVAADHGDLAVKAFAFAPVPDEVAVRSLGWPLLMAALLVPYIKRSQRVKGTFTER